MARAMIHRSGISFISVRRWMIHFALPILYASARRAPHRIGLICAVQSFFVLRGFTILRSAGDMRSGLSCFRPSATDISSFIRSFNIEQT